MIVSTPVLTARGSEFSPDAAERLLGFNLGVRRNEPGDVGIRGKFRGVRVPYGSLILDLGEVAPFKDTVYYDDSNADLLPLSMRIFSQPSIVDVLRECGATDVVLTVNVAHDGQCNLELGPALLRALAQLNVVVAISCYEAD
jgi:hypothetical protein